MNRTDEPATPGTHPRDVAEERYKAALKALDDEQPDVAEALLRQAAELVPQFKVFERLGELGLTHEEVMQACYRTGQCAPDA